MSQCFLFGPFTSFRLMVLVPSLPPDFLAYYESEDWRQESLKWQSQREAEQAEEKEGKMYASTEQGAASLAAPCLLVKENKESEPIFRREELVRIILIWCECS